MAVSGLNPYVAKGACFSNKCTIRHYEYDKEVKSTQRHFRRTSFAGLPASITCYRKVTVE